ncbi:hypothetical protein THAOC_19899, partial [Thalassiosira oceanica]
MQSDYQKALEDELKKTIAVCVMAALAGVGAVGKAERCGSLRESQARHARTNSSARISGVNRASRTRTSRCGTKSRATTTYGGDLHGQVVDVRGRCGEPSTMRSRARLFRRIGRWSCSGRLQSEKGKKGDCFEAHQLDSWMTARRTGRFQDLKDGTYGFRVKKPLGKCATRPTRRPDDMKASPKYLYQGRGEVHRGASHLTRGRRGGGRRKGGEEGGDEEEAQYSERDKTTESEAYGTSGRFDVARVAIGAAATTGWLVRSAPTRHAQTAVTLITSIDPTVSSGIVEWGALDELTYVFVITYLTSAVERPAGTPNSTPSRTSPYSPSFDASGKGPRNRAPRRTGQGLARAPRSPRARLGGGRRGGTPAAEFGVRAGPGGGSAAQRRPGGQISRSNFSGGRFRAGEVRRRKSWDSKRNRGLDLAAPESVRRTHAGLAFEPSGGRDDIERARERWAESLGSEVEKRWSESGKPRLGGEVALGRTDHRTNRPGLEVRSSSEAITGARRGRHQHLRVRHRFQGPDVPLATARRSMSAPGTGSPGDVAGDALL